MSENKISNKIVDEEFREKDFRDLVNAPVYALNGLSKDDADWLWKAFAIRTVGDLARNKYFKSALAIKHLAETEVDVLEGKKVEL